MFGLFKDNKEKERQPDWYLEVKESRERWFLFLDKLEVKMEELCSSAIPELKEVLQTDEDIYKRTFNRVYSGVLGQLENIRTKARETFDEKIICLYEDIKENVSVLDSNYNLLSDFRNSCGDRYHKVFEDKYDYWRKELEKTQERDLEIEYKKILDEYEITKDKFNCKQCGGNLTIDRIFLIETYITCTYCQTQNTFQPSTQARMLQNIARGLAEQRTTHLFENYSKENEKERKLYHERHELRLSTIHEKNKNVLTEKQKLMDELEKQRKEAIENAPLLYKIYLRAMYDEWNKITPDLKEHNEIMYKNQLDSK